jgi:hypothetical protein
MAEDLWVMMGIEHMRFLSPDWEKNMVASYDTIVGIYDIMRKHCTKEQLDKIILDLMDIRGNKSFRESIDRLADLHKEMRRRK